MTSRSSMVSDRLGARRQKTCSTVTSWRHGSGRFFTLGQKGLVIFGLIGLLSSASYAEPSLRFTAEELEGEEGRGLPEDSQSKLFSSARIGPLSVAAPIGHFLIIREGKNYCALRFTYPRKTEEKPSSWFRQPGRHLFAGYELYNQADGSGDFTKSNVEKGKGTVSIYPLVGISRLFSYWPGDRVLRCGSERYAWSYPSGARMREDAEIYIAPTRWQTLSEIDVHNSCLTWYGYDRTILGDIAIPLEDLPGGDCR